MKIPHVGKADCLDVSTLNS